MTGSRNVESAIGRFLANNWQWVIGALLATAGAACAVAVWANNVSRDLKDAQAEFGAVREEIRSVRREIAQLRVDGERVRESLLTFLMEPTPDKSAIARSLAVGKPTVQGIEQFREGDYRAAFQSFEAGAAKGDPNAKYAARAAGALITHKVQAPETSEADRETLRAILEGANINWRIQPDRQLKQYRPNESE